jgi:hypothetical protein
MISSCDVFYFHSRVRAGGVQKNGFELEVPLVQCVPARPADTNAAPENRARAWSVFAHQIRFCFYLRKRFYLVNQDKRFILCTKIQIFSFVNWYCKSFPAYNCSIYTNALVYERHTENHKQKQHKHTHTSARLGSSSGIQKFGSLQQRSPPSDLFSGKCSSPAVHCFGPVYPGNRPRICLRKLCQTQARSLFFVTLFLVCLCRSWNNCGWRSVWFILPISLIAICIYIYFEFCK